jgi:hypothetical protein
MPNSCNAVNANCCSLIVDGHHVHPATPHSAIRAKAPGKMMLEKDAIPPVGSDEPNFRQRNGVDLAAGTAGRTTLWLVPTPRNGSKRLMAWALLERRAAEMHLQCAISRPISGPPESYINLTTQAAKIA